MRLLGIQPITSVTKRFRVTGLQLALSQVTLPLFFGARADISGSWPARSAESPV